MSDEKIISEGKAQGNMSYDWKGSEEVNENWLANTRLKIWYINSVIMKINVTNLNRNCLCTRKYLCIGIWGCCSHVQRLQLRHSLGSVNYQGPRESLWNNERDPLLRSSWRSGPSLLVSRKTKQRLAWETHLCRLYVFTRRSFHLSAALMRGYQTLTSTLKSSLTANRVYICALEALNCIKEMCLQATVNVNIHIVGRSHLRSPKLRKALWLRSNCNKSTKILKAINNFSSNSSDQTLETRLAFAEEQL